MKAGKYKVQKVWIPHWVSKNLARQTNGAAGASATCYTEGRFLFCSVIATTQTQPHLEHVERRAYMHRLCLTGSLVSTAKVEISKQNLNLVSGKTRVYLFRVHVRTQATEIQAEEEFMFPRQFQHRILYAISHWICWYLHWHPLVYQCMKSSASRWWQTVGRNQCFCF